MIDMLPFLLTEQQRPRPFVLIGRCTHRLVNKSALGYSGTAAATCCTRAAAAAVADGGLPRLNVCAKYLPSCS